MALEPDRSEQERLFRVRRVLATLDVATRFTSRGDALKGELTVWEGLSNPVSGEAIRHIAFTVAGDGRLRLDDPPAVRGLQGPDALAARSVDDLVALIRSGLARRMSALQEQCTRLRRLGLEPEPDAERVVASVRVGIDAVGVAVLEVGDGGLVARYLVPALGGDRSPVPLGGFTVALDQADDRVDLELMVGAGVDAARRRHAPARARAPEPAPQPVAAGPAAKEDLSLGRLAPALGEGASLLPGFVAVRSFRVGEREVRLELRHREAQRFDAELVDAAGTIWTGCVDLETIGEISEVVFDLLDASPRASRRPGAAVARGAPDPRLVAGLLPPVAGEVWVMDVSIEEDDDHEIRYRGMSVGGISFGAPRVLPRAAFDAAYVAVAGGHRMLVQVVEVADDSVSYQRLDARRNPVGTPKRCPLVVFLANFVVEAAAF